MWCPPMSISTGVNTAIPQLRELMPIAPFTNTLCTGLQSLWDSPITELSAQLLKPLFQPPKKGTDPSNNPTTYMPDVTSQGVGSLAGFECAINPQEIGPEEPSVGNNTGGKHGKRATTILPLAQVALNPTRDAYGPTCPAMEGSPNVATVTTNALAVTPRTINLLTLGGQGNRYFHGGGLDLLSLSVCSHRGRKCDICPP